MIKKKSELLGPTAYVYSLMPDWKRTENVRLHENTRLMRCKYKLMYECECSRSFLCVSLRTRICFLWISSRVLFRFAHISPHIKFPFRAKMDALVNFNQVVCRVRNYDMCECINLVIGTYLPFEHSHRTLRLRRKISIFAVVCCGWLHFFAYKIYLD